MPVKVTRTFATTARGIGKPDYSKEIALGQVRPGLTLKYRQNLHVGSVTFSNIASFFSWVKVPLAAGATGHLVDIETGFDLPYTCEAGYIYSVIQIGHSGIQDNTLRVYLSTPALGLPLSLIGYLGTMASGNEYNVAGIAPLSTVMIDPGAVYVHQFDAIIENLGGADFEGSCTLSAIKEAVGTPSLPTTKTVKCKWCGHEWVVPRETTFIKCPNCGEMNIYCDFSRIRSIG